jgi:hypothetical protein
MISNSWILLGLYCFIKRRKLQDIWMIDLDIILNSLIRSVAQNNHIMTDCRKISLNHMVCRLKKMKSSRFSFIHLIMIWMFLRDSNYSECNIFAPPVSPFETRIKDLSENRSLCRARDWRSKNSRASEKVLQRGSLYRLLARRMSRSSKPSGQISLKKAAACGLIQFFNQSRFQPSRGVGIRECLR